MMNEAAGASHIRLDAAQQGIELWRNNVGVLLDERGRPVRYGLCNDSAALNKRVKSSDYVGIVPVLITPAMVGRRLGVFLAVETKPEGWTMPLPTNKREFEHCIAQSCFHDIVRNAGGKAGFATGVEDFRRIVYL